MYAKENNSIILNTEKCSTSKRCFLTMNFLFIYFLIKKHFYSNNKNFIPRIVFIINIFLASSLYKNWEIFWKKKSIYIHVLKQILKRTTVNHCFKVCILKTFFLLLKRDQNMALHWNMNKYLTMKRKFNN